MSKNVNTISYGGQPVRARRGFHAAPRSQFRQRGGAGAASEICGDWDSKP